MWSHEEGRIQERTLVSARSNNRSMCLVGLEADIVCTRIDTVWLQYHIPESMVPL